MQSSSAVEKKSNSGNGAYKRAQRVLETPTGGLDGDDNTEHNEVAKSLS
jgi:hypothetical protein